MTQRGQTNGFCREITKTVTDKIGADVLYIWVVSVFLLVVVLRELLLRPANYQDCLLSTGANILVIHDARDGNGVRLQ